MQTSWDCQFVMMVVSDSLPNQSERSAHRHTVACQRANFRSNPRIFSTPEPFGCRFPSVRGSVMRFHKHLQQAPRLRMVISRRISVPALPLTAPPFESRTVLRLRKRTEQSFGNIKTCASSKGTSPAAVVFLSRLPALDCEDFHGTHLLETAHGPTLARLRSQSLPDYRLPVLLMVRAIHTEDMNSTSINVNFSPKRAHRGRG